MRCPFAERDEVSEQVSEAQQSTLGSSDARVKRHLESEPIDTMLADHASGRRDHGQVLWMLLTLEVFLRREGW